MKKVLQILRSHIILYNYENNGLKFMFSKKATSIWRNLMVDLTLPSGVKFNSSVRFCQIVVAFRKPEYWSKLKKLHLNLKSVNNLIAQSCTYLCGDIQKERCAGRYLVSSITKLTKKCTYFYNKKLRNKATVFLHYYHGSAVALKSKKCT